jgi:hypothetical protein
VRGSRQSVERYAQGTKLKCRANNHATQNQVDDIANLEHEQWKHVFDVNIVRLDLPVIYSRQQKAFDGDHKV